MTTTDINPAPGFHLDMPFDDYKSARGLNASVLVEGLKSMKHLRYAIDHPREDTAAMRKGRRIHTAFFEPDQFSDRYAIWDGGDRRSKEYKAWAEEQTAEIITLAEAEEAVAACQSALKHPLIRELIGEGSAEVSVFGTDSGMGAKGRIDWLAGPEKNWRAIVDLKTAADIEQWAFGRQFAKLGYHVKLAWYRRRVKEHLGEALPVYVFALESSPPFDVVRVPVPDAVLEFGEQECIGLMQRIKMCRRNNYWPGISGEDYDLHFPEHAMPDEQVVFDG